MIKAHIVVSDFIVLVTDFGLRLVCRTFKLWRGSCDGWLSETDDFQSAVGLDTTTSASTVVKPRYCSLRNWFSGVQHHRNLGRVAIQTLGT